MNTLRNLKLSAGKLNTNNIRIFWFLLTLALLVLGAGAPEGPAGGWMGG